MKAKLSDHQKRRKDKLLNSPRFESHFGPGKCDAADVPIAKKKQTLEYLREKIHVRPRTNTIQSIARP